MALLHRQMITKPIKEEIENKKTEIWGRKQRAVFWYIINCQKRKNEILSLFKNKSEKYQNKIKCLDLEIKNLESQIFEQAQASS
jgi:hypothetical protein